jgi:peptidoglycan hydrolase CwlO-like protein
MKKLLAALLVLGTLAACNNESKSVENKVDSLNERKDTLLEKVDSTADAKIDSIKDRSKELKEKFDSSIEKRKDSVKGK